MTNQRLILLIVAATASLAAFARDESEALAPAHPELAPRHWPGPSDAPIDHRRGD